MLAPFFPEPGSLTLSANRLPAMNPQIPLDFRLAGPAGCCLGCS
jgi:hypothetical protein